MKKCIAVFLVTIVMSALCGCNRQMVDLTYSYDYAQIKMPDGTIVEGKLDSWIAGVIMRENRFKLLLMVQPIL